MHIRNHDNEYTSTSDAMSYWPEVETAIGVKMETNGGLKLVSPFPLNEVLSKSVTINPKSPKPDTFRKRVQTKGLLNIWPELVINDCQWLLMVK